MTPSALRHIKKWKTVVCCYDDNEQKYKVIAPTPTSPGTTSMRGPTPITCSPARASRTPTTSSASRFSRYHRRRLRQRQRPFSCSSSQSQYRHRSERTGRYRDHYSVDPDGDNVCVTGYLDDCRRTIKIWWARRMIFRTAGGCATAATTRRICRAGLYGRAALAVATGRLMMTAATTTSATRGES